MIDVELQLTSLIERFERLSLNSVQRKKLDKRLARAVMVANAKHIRQRTAPDGQPWAEPRRKRKKPKSKKLEGMARHLTYRMQSDGSVVIRFKTRFRGVIANQQHAGFTQKRTAEQAARMYRRKNDGEPSNKLAKALKQAGYTTTRQMARGKSKTVSPTIRWIKDTMTERQCVAQLNELKGKKGKMRWRITIPKRELLGTHPDVVMTELQKFINP